MNTHKNARMTVHGRTLLVKRIVEQGWPVTEAAKAAGVSIRTAYKWLARYRVGGERMLHDRSSAPARCPHRLPAETLAEIERLRRQGMTGPQIAQSLGRRSTVGAVLRHLVRAGVELGLRVHGGPDAGRLTWRRETDDQDSGPRCCRSGGPA